VRLPAFAALLAAAVGLALRPAPAAAQAPVAAAPRRAPATMPQPTPLEQSINKRCVGCHEKAFKRFATGHIHAPVRAGACSFCHLDHGPENRLILLGREDRVCARCHDTGSQAARNAHGGYSPDGSRCTECHDPHSGSNPMFLYERRHSPFADGVCGSSHGKQAAGWKISGNPS
jgi:predicted CXXCH cytochrome family protein